MEKLLCGLLGLGGLQDEPVEMKPPSFRVLGFLELVWRLAE
jgi:hypothetical protein